MEEFINLTVAGITWSSPRSFFMVILPWAIERPQPRPTHPEVAEDRETTLTTEQEFIDWVKERITSGQAELLGEGREGRVYLLAETAQTPPWVLKEIKIPKNCSPELRQILEQKLKREFELQQQAHALIARARRENPDTPLAAIPQPIALLTEGDSLWLVMDQVPGSDFYTQALRIWLTYFYSDQGGLDYVDPEDPEAGPLGHWSLDKLRDEVFSDEHVSMLPPRFIEEYSSGKVIDSTALFNSLLQAGTRLLADSEQSYPFFSPAQVAQVQRTIQFLNRAGFYHRDLTPHNLMLTPDGQVYVIDFGRSRYDQGKTREFDPLDRIFEEETLTGTNRYLVDQQAVDALTATIKLAENLATARRLRPVNPKS